MVLPVKLPFDPACAPLLLGSLPYASAAQALHISQRHTHELLAWPQLWQRSQREQMVPQSATGFPGLTAHEGQHQLFVQSALAQEQIERLDLAYLEGDYGYAGMTDREAAGLFELLHQSARLAGVRAVKGQMLGPISLALQLTDEHQRPLVYDPVLFDAVAQFVRMRVAWQAQRLASLGKPTIMCLDEPFLEMVGSPFLPIDWDDARTQINLALSDVGGCRALFVGGAIDWGHLLRMDIDLIIGDVFEHSAPLVGAAEALTLFVAAGGHIGLGIVPTEADLLASITADELVAQLAMCIDALAAAEVDTTRLLRQAVITPNGALGALAPEEAEHALKLLAAVSALVRERYMLGGQPQEPQSERMSE